MSRTKGTQKTGGRELGTPNRVTADLRTCIEQLINDNIEKIKTDFADLEAKDRLIIFERLLQYVIPKKREEEQVNNDQRSEIIKRLFSNDFQSIK